MSRPIAALLLCLAVAAPSSAPAEKLPGDGVRMVLEGPATPYAAVRYEVAFRRGTVIAEVDKAFAAGFGSRGEVGLLSRDDLGALLDALEALGGFTLRSQTDAAPRTVWRIDLRRGTRHHHIRVHDPERIADGRYRALIERVRELVERTVGPVPYRDGMLLDAEYGRLRLRSTPRATLMVDDVPMPGTTPIDDLRLTAGAHELKLTPVGGDPGDPHVYVVKIVVGKTTSLTVELR